MYGWEVTTNTLTNLVHTLRLSAEGVREPDQPTGIFIYGQPCPVWGHLLPSLESRGLSLVISQPLYHSLSLYHYMCLVYYVDTSVKAWHGVLFQHELLCMDF